MVAREVGAQVVELARAGDRGARADRYESYHDMQRPPRHAYVAFYLWLRTQTDVLIHMGAHGTLEWLPGKAVALSADGGTALVGAFGDNNDQGAAWAYTGLPCTLDVDGNRTIDALTDGLILLRAMFGMTGASIIFAASATPNRAFHVFVM